jgi:hypothetical protein
MPSCDRRRSGVYVSVVVVAERLSVEAWSDARHESKQAGAYAAAGKRCRLRYCSYTTYRRHPSAHSLHTSAPPRSDGCPGALTSPPPANFALPRDSLLRPSSADSIRHNSRPRILLPPSRVTSRYSRMFSPDMLYSLFAAPLQIQCVTPIEARRQASPSPMRGLSVVGAEKAPQRTAMPTCTLHILTWSVGSFQV